MVGLRTSKLVWDALASSSAFQAQAHAMELHSELRTITKGNLTITDYLQRVKKIADNLAAIGQQVPKMNLFLVSWEALDQNTNHLCRLLLLAHPRSPWKNFMATCLRMNVGYFVKQNCNASYLFKCSLELDL